MADRVAKRWQPFGAEITPTAVINWGSRPGEALMATCKPGRTPRLPGHARRGGYQDCTTRGAARGGPGDALKIDVIDEPKSLAASGPR